MVNAFFIRSKHPVAMHIMVNLLAGFQPYEHKVDVHFVGLPMNSGVPAIIFGLGFTVRSWAVPKSIIFRLFPSLSFSTMFSGCRC